MRHKVPDPLFSADRRKGKLEQWAIKKTRSRKCGPVRRVAAIVRLEAMKARQRRRLGAVDAQLTAFNKILLDIHRPEFKKVGVPMGKMRANVTELEVIPLMKRRGIIVNRLEQLKKIELKALSRRSRAAKKKK